MKVQSLERRSVREPPDLISAHVYRGWVRPAWMWSCILGSVVAITVSAAIAILISTYLAQYRSGAPRLAAVELMALAAGLEGAIIGYFQWRVLRRLFPTMASGPWVSATMIAAGSGCVLNWLPTSFSLTAALASSIGDVTPGPTVIAKFSMVTGALIGLVWGSAQYAVLRLHVHRAGSWISASVVSWIVSFVWLYLAAFFPDRTTSPIIYIVLAASSALVLGSSLGVLQGRVLARLHSRLLVATSP